MAAPPSVTVHNLTGTYTLNNKLSDPMDAVLKMQGVGWLVRQAAAYSTVTVNMKQYARPEDGVVCLDVDQVSTGGIRSTEERVLNWEWFEKNDRIWGKVRGKARLVLIFIYIFEFRLMELRANSDFSILGSSSSPSSMQTTTSRLAGSRSAWRAMSLRCKSTV